METEQNFVVFYDGSREAPLYQEQCPVEVAKKYSKTVQRILEDSDDYWIPVIGASHEDVKFVVKYMTMHGLENTPLPIMKPLPSADLSLYVWLQDFDLVKDLTEVQILNLLQTSTSLECEDLMDLLAAYVATKFLAMTYEELKKEYNFTEELKPETEKILKQEHDNIFRNTRFEPKNLQPPAHAHPAHAHPTQ